MRREDEATELWRLCPHGHVNAHETGRWICPIDMPPLPHTHTQTCAERCDGGLRIVVDYQAAYDALYRVLAIQGDGMQSATVAAVDAALTTRRNDG